MSSSSVRHDVLIILGLLAVTALGGTSAYGGQYTLLPKLTIVEELNDNIYETKDNRQSDLITHIVPSLNFTYAAKQWDWNVTYAPEYRHYAKGSGGNELLQNLAASGNICLINNFLYLSISDVYNQSSNDGNRATPYSNQYNQNIFTISPYIQYKLNSRWTAETGYRYVNRYYSGTNSNSNYEHGVFLKLSRELTSNASVFTRADLARVYNSDNTSYDRLTHSVGGQYRYATGSSVNAEGGYAIFSPQNGSSQLSPYWNVGLKHTMDAYQFTLDSGVSYDTTNVADSERRYLNVRLTKEYKRGILGVYGGYSETVDKMANTADSKWFTAGVDATYALTRRAMAHAGVSTDRYLDSTQYDQQYRNSFTVGVSYDLFSDLTAGLDYNRIAYSDTIFSPSGPIVVNRIMFSLTKSFTGLRFKGN